MDKQERKINMKKKHVIVKILIHREEDDLDGEIALITRNYKRFLREKVEAITSRRQDDTDKERRLRWMDLRIKEKKENSEDKVQCYKCKDYGHMMHDCPFKSKDLDPKGKKVL